MNEEDWLACTDPDQMLDFLQGKTSDRKFRLFAVACCRHIWDLFAEERSRAAVEVAERYADGRADPRECAAARNAALAATGSIGGQAAWAAYWATSIKAAASIWNASAAAIEAAARAAAQAARDAGMDQAGAWDAARAAEAREQARLLRDIRGNPFRPVAVDLAWLAWGNGTVTNLARSLYEERAFDRLPILGDALEDAGCDDALLLSHCRGPGSHVLGCWVVDAILGKQ